MCKFTHVKMFKIVSLVWNACLLHYIYVLQFLNKFLVDIKLEGGVWSKISPEICSSRVML